tara:strand:- start:1767 stop:2180 length:414 start_codon:yes stop_codon:yes gene_type:complete
MALVGGGGSPNVAGSNPAGTGTSLNYVGQHAYAYSGTIAITGSATTMLEFVTAEQYVLGELNFSGVWGNLGSSAVTMTLNINGEDTIVNTVANTSARDVEGTPYPILLPPYSRIVISMSQASGSDRDFQATIVGRVY